MKKKIPVRQITAWLIVAVSAPILSLAHTNGWPAIAGGVFIGMAITACRIWIGSPIPKWVHALEISGAVLYLGTAARESGTCWQEGIDAAYLPVVLLIAAAFAVRKGATQGSRSGASLLWIVAPGISIILLAGIGEWSVPTVTKVDADALWEAAPLFLLPLLSAGATGKGKSVYGAAALVGIAGIAVTVWLNGYELTQNAVNAFYEYSKGITLFGAAERFEAVTACLLTAGWYALFAYLLASVYEITEECKKGAGRRSVWCGVATAILILYKLPISSTQAGIFCVISWGVLPILTQAVGWLKKSEKSEKTY